MNEHAHVLLRCEHRVSIVPKILLNRQVHTLYFACWIQPDVTLQGRSPPEAVDASFVFTSRGLEIQAPRSRRASSLFGLASGRRLTSNTAMNSFVLSPLLAFRYSATSPPHHSRLAWGCSNATRRLLISPLLANTIRQFTTAREEARRASDVTTPMKWRG